MSSFISIGSGTDTKVKVNPVGTSRSLTFSGAGVTVVDDPALDTIDVIITGSGVGEANLGANVGTGEGTIFRDKTIVTLNFKSIKAGSNVTVTNNANDITIASTGGGTGEANTYSNASTGGVPIILTKTGVDLPFKGVAAGSTKVTVTNDTTNKNVVIDVSDATTSQLGAVQLSSVGGTTAGQVVQASDTRLSDARTPIAHHASHGVG